MKQVATEVSEILEKEKKKNLVIYNLPESDLHDGKERKAYDEMMCNSLVKDESR